jgi:hypothetical protein
MPAKVRRRKSSHSSELSPTRRHRNAGRLRMTDLIATKNGARLAERDSSRESAPTRRASDGPGLATTHRARGVMAERTPSKN